MKEQDAMRRRLSALQFAAWELHLFLDSHPNNIQAATRLADYRNKIETLKTEYEEKYGPLNLTSRTASRWAWITDPWPWDVQEDD